MIPYFEVQTIQIGPVPVTSFGLTTGLAILVTIGVVLHQGRKRGLDTKLLPDATFWAVVFGLIGAHLFDVFYHPDHFREVGPIEFLKVWDGLASFGGIFAGFITLRVFFYLRRIPFTPYTDTIALGLTPGWGLARLGCFLVHDHPGVRTDFFLAVQFPHGPRHDLGLYDALLLFAITGLLFALARVPWFHLRLRGVLALTYGLGRFGCDFLRARDLADQWVDARYFGLTPAQYGCLLLIGAGVWWLWFARVSEAATALPAAYEPAETSA